jgi:cell division protease FtsH
MDDKAFRRQLGKLVQQLLDEKEEEPEPVTVLLQGHLGEEAKDLPILAEELPTWDRPNLQLALDAALTRPGWSHEVVGLAGQAAHYEGLSLADLLTGSDWLPEPGSPRYVNAAVGPDRTLPCLALGLLLVRSPEGPMALLVRRAERHGLGPGQLVVEGVAPRPGVVEELLADLRRLMAEHDVYRGQVLTVTVDPHGSADIVFLERPSLIAQDLVLPDGVLERLELHVLGPTRHREALLRSGRHLSRGLLLWGPPGTGKTHTVRYLVSAATDATVVLLAGGTLGMVGAFSALARRLAPAIVVLEDVDLVAQERTYGPFGSSPVLFELMNEMDGLAEDADVAFVLTTNRPDALEPALAARPGRIDLAVELPLPDDAARRRLLELYASGLDLALADPDAVIARTSGVTASFVKELLRRAAVEAAETGRTQVRDEDLATVLDDLLADSSALTRVLLGGEAPRGGVAPGPHDWLEAAPTFELGPGHRSETGAAQLSERREPPGVESPEHGKP